ncbi:beta strand repeat-containing protein [Mesorhizobium opportunistum]|uniref:Outer membrane adhesin like protein n=1 Tax=Mesorhizobium opportunistum (strain LMG 24607 / HAMBI 3007 / WSM2075) TaxID=536019 RepID=F7Y059_MESOW|nr:VCBS domain-containing protein [Mesorhizobium opportunistum]AEH90425.1 outer membrane adhesin like protein [Mesorhizobium opportunistum WSM2075]
MATKIADAGGTTASFSNTPQAQDDAYNLTEDTVVLASGSQTVIVLDVMANDQGGNAKSLFSVDDGISGSTATKQYAPIDLTHQDYQTLGISTWETIGEGVSIRINSGKVEMDLTGYLAAHGFSSLQAMGPNDHFNETFTYAIKLGNGTLSWASVSVNIQGTNDAAVISGVSTGSVIEAGGVANAIVGTPTVSGTLTDTDVDNTPNTFQAVAAGAASDHGYGTYQMTAGGVWTFTLNNNNAAVQGLNVGQNLTETFTVHTQDGTAQVVTVTIHGTNDAAILSADVRHLTETNSATDISSSGTLTISDVDSPATFVAQSGTPGSYGAFSIDAAGAWTYTASSAHNEFAAGTTYTDTFDVVSADGTHTSVTINIHGTNDAAILSADVRHLTETNSATDISSSGTLTISDVDSPATFVAQSGTPGSYGAFSIDAAGAWTYTASSAHNEFAAGTTYTDTFDVVSADGTHTSVTINIDGTNDAAILSADVRHLTETNSATDISSSGTLTISDVDSPATFVAQSGTPGSYGAFSIDAAGAWTYTASSAHNEFAAGTTYTDTFDVVSADGTHTSVTINIDGTNDAAILSADVRHLTETNSATDISSSGTLTISDVDSPATFVAQSGTPGSYGAFSIDAAGAWTYTASSAHNEFAAGTTYTDTFDVVSADGTHTSVTINIDGTNDNSAPVAVADTNWAKEDTNTSATGNVLQTLAHNGAPSGTFSDHADTDPDGDTLAVSALSGGIDNGTTYTKTGTYGTVVITKATGAYTYTLANAQANVQALAAGQTVTDSFTYTVSDGHGGTTSANLAVTVFGTDEPSSTLIGTVVQGHQGSNNDPSIATINFSTAVHTNFANISDAIHITAGGALVPGTGSFNAAHDQYTFSVIKTGNNGSSYNLTIDAGAFSDNSGDTNAIKIINGTLKPAGTSGEPINLALTDPSHEGALITVTVKDVPSGWTIDGATHNADGSWTTQTNDLHGLTVTTPASFTGAAVLDVQMTWTNADGTLGSASIADNVEAYAPGSPIFAWSGDDVLTGSSGNDLFVFSQPIGVDMVHSFDVAADQIDLIGYNGLADFADLQTHIADDAHGNAVITLGDGQSITLDGVHSNALTAGNFVFDQTPVVNNSGTMTIGDGALLPLSGIIDNSGLISLDSAGGDTLLQVIQHGVTLQGGGQILMSDSAANIISGTGPDVSLVNVDNTISGAGQLGGGMLGLDNRGTIIASGSNALVVDTGGSVVINSGTLEATGSGGLTVAGGVANSGMLWANGGDIVIHGQVTGDGDATIGNLSKIEFGGASSTDVTFGHDAAGTLQLDDSFDYSGRIGGITNDDKLDLGDILFGAGTTAVYQANQDGSGGTLTVSDGTHGAALHLVGSYDANAFKLADDGQGHTVVSYNPAEFTLTGIGDGAISSDFVV